MLPDSETSLVQPSATSLVDLPPELLTVICVFVDCRTVACCRLVCRRLRDVVDASLELQYRIELVRDGMTDQSARATQQGLQLTLTTSDRLARLRQLRTAWTTLNWTRCVTVPMPGPCSAYELVGGMFCKTQPRGRGRRDGAHGFGGFWGGNFGFEGHGAWHGHHDHDGQGEPEVDGGGDGSRTMSVTWLPGRLGGGENEVDRGRTDVRDDLGIPTRDFAMDPSQDLMVLFKGDNGDVGMPGDAYPGTIELHVRTISSNQTHPEARVPVLCSPVLYPIMNVFVQIADDVVGIMYYLDSTQPRLTIWNWKTGSMVMDCGNGHLSHLDHSTWDFAFINSRALFFTTTNDGGTLELYTFTCDPVPSPSEPPISRPTSALTHVATLHLPSVHASVRVLDVSTHAGPFLAGCPPNKPFMASNEERIHVLTIQYVHLPTLAGPRMRLKTCVFVHNRMLVAYLTRPNDRAATALGVAWSDWRTQARMLTYGGMFQWLRYVHGQRVVLLQPSSDMHTSTIEVLDFNVRRAFCADAVDARRVECVDNSEAGDSAKDGDVHPSRCNTTIELVDYPTRIVAPSIFTDVVESELPYRNVRRDVCSEYSGVMIDDERLVGLKRYPVVYDGRFKRDRGVYDVMHGREKADLSCRSGWVVMSC
ncbi:hypothetical protein JVU11DRAFT_6788 [Chiua virens]|nr:hypothetical protein JVU11DRAFT_6788 [Chiua virens]